MKGKRSIGMAAALCAAWVFVSGCYTPPEFVDNSPRFHEASTVNVTLRFHQWEHLFIVQPDFRDHGFLRPLKANDLGNVFNTLQVRRGTAVVLLGWNYDRQDLAKLVEKWNGVLRNHGFTRVVCLRDNESASLDGMSIISDWKLAGDAPRQTASLQGSGANVATQP